MAPLRSYSSSNIRDGAIVADEIPDDVIQHVREVFSRANVAATNTLARQPAMHEEALDLQIFAEIDKAGPRLMPASNSSVEIQTHWLGGRRHFQGTWEIADIALAVTLRRAGRLIWQKIALLQSKRLYSREIPVIEIDKADYAIGIARLIDKGQHIAIPAPRRFSFSEDCVYRALTASSEQTRHIDEYARQRDIPVYYSLYNPPSIPFEGTIPSVMPLSLTSEDIRCGCRVLRAADVHFILSHLPVGKAPTFAELALPDPKISDNDPFSRHGWRLETFVADEVLRCREGRRFTREHDPDLRALLYGRSGPIASTIVIEVNLSGADDSDVKVSHREGPRPLDL